DGFLGNDANLRPQRGERHVADVVTIDGYSAGSHIEKSRDKLHQSALAGAAGADDGHNLSGMNFQINVAKNRARGAANDLTVGKANLVKAYTVTKVRHRSCALALFDLIFFIHKTEDFRRRTQGLLKTVVEESEFANGIVEPENRNDENQESRFREYA